MSRAGWFVALAALLFTSSAHAATIMIQNNDGVGEGFNDPTAPLDAAQAGNNPGTTLGALRLNLFNAAAQRWGQLLNSNVTITIGAQFNPLACSQFGGTLGAAGSNGSSANSGGGLPNIAYHIALAESLAGVNLNAASVEINAAFNSSVDLGNVNCLGGGGFYYGLDGNVPDGMAALYPVVLHEIAHGLGFGPLANLTTGAFSGSGGFPDAYSRNLRDLETSESWDTMSNAERTASAINDPNLVWNGAQVTANRSVFLDPAPEVQINAPPGIVGTHIGNLGEEPTIVMPQAGVTADVVDGDALLAAALSDSCTGEAVPAMSGKIVLFEEAAGCSAAFPAFIAQVNGAIGAVLSNPNPIGLPNMAGQIGNQEVTIPYVGATQAVGNSLRNNIANATIRNSPTVLTGNNQERLRINAPPVLAQGASVAHFTPEAQPDLLMQPSLGALEFNAVDLTLSAFADMGWSVNSDDVIYADGFESQ